MSVEGILRLYAKGYFPMADGYDSDEVAFYIAKTRGLIPITDFHVPRSLKKAIRKGRFEVRANHDFKGVMQACAEPREGREQTWINPLIERAFHTLHAEGHAHSVEVYKDNKLVGGLYGLSIGKAFVGESMFSREVNASKIALVYLVAMLDKMEYALLDAQMPNPHLEQFGAYELSNDEFQYELVKAIAQDPNGYWCGTSLAFDGAFSFAAPSSVVPEALVSEFIQSRTQIS